MKPPCILITETLLPALRYIISRNLSAEGMSQQRIAERLGITQAMVSKYLRGGEVLLQRFDEEERRRLEGIASEITGMILRGSSDNEISEHLCKACFNLRESSRLCNLCLQMLRREGDCDICMNIRSSRVLGERFEILEDLENAIGVLESSPEVVRLLPEVRMNIAMASRDASSPEEVAAIPGRLIEIMGTVRAPMKPEFGVSRHISRVLLEAMKKTGKRAICNIRFDEGVKRTLERLQMKLYFVERNGGNEEVWKLLKDIPEDTDCIVDPGGFGIEPVVYVLGDRATEVAEKVIRIAKNL